MFKLKILFDFLKSTPNKKIKKQISIPKKKNILIIGNLHLHPSSKTFQGKFITIIKEIEKQVYFISGDQPPNYDNVKWTQQFVNPRSKFKFIKSQLKLFWILAKQKLDYDIAIILPTSFISPAIFSRLMRKKVIIFVDGMPKNIFSIMFARMNFILANRLVVDSENVKRVWKIESNPGKIMNGSAYIDTNFFIKKKKISERERIIGYIGNLEKAKGIRELIEAISIINKIPDKHEIKFIIGGVGKLENLVRIFSSENNNVKFMGFVPAENMPEFYNNIKLLVLPSHSEGLPNVILEAMACGTPVLATAVGGIPDIIEDEETGFIMENNSPKIIAENILRALNNPKLEIIAENGRELINRDFLFENAVERYRKILSDL